jgi:hypothetical protein
MTDLHGARQAEREGRFEEAAAAYERLLATDSLPLESVIGAAPSRGNQFATARSRRGERS